ncbi:Gfo/Idh/MocA family protein [Microbacterium sp. DT81.1]|uniref:Gfo/Idh/MocA family protein n=1 Tax=Microbacterium sp. DT81.1 TaxID=3393413 RepID=UPI003CEA2BA7
MAVGPAIALIGCGGISAAQLEAYRAADLNLTLLCDRTLAKARGRRDEYYPHAAITDSVGEVLGDPSIEIVDIATHVTGRTALVERALSAGKHVLSQKPFVLDLEEGERLIALADQEDRLLAVNHNGRWAPHFAIALDAVRGRQLGDVYSADFAVYWPHDQLFEHDPHFSRMTDLVLYDFGIHWFDLVAQLLEGSGSPLRVFAVASVRPDARIPVPTNAIVVIEYERATASIIFRASSPRAESGRFRIEGSSGTLVHDGESLGGALVELHNEAGRTDIAVEGDWWSRGMIGTMQELIDAIGEGRQPSNRASTALPGLSLCFAAIESVRTGLPVDPRSVRRYTQPGPSQG